MKETVAVQLFAIKRSREWIKCNPQMTESLSYFKRPMSEMPPKLSKMTGMPQHPK
jgi:hypothetical protein